MPDVISFTMPAPPPTPDLNFMLSFKLAPAAAVALFKSKGLKPTFAWQDMIAQEHQRAFTVAKMMDVDLLGDVRGLVDEAIQTGKSVAWFKEKLEPVLIRKGWWGRKVMIDPLTGAAVEAELGSLRRLDLIFRTNMQSAYSVGHWEKVQEQKKQAPWLMYDAIDDHRTRPEHAALDGVILRADDPWWERYFPPGGWNCRCGTIQLSDEQLKRHGLKPSKRPKIKTRKWRNPRTGKTRRVPVDLDPGWDYNPGDYDASMMELRRTLAEKIRALPRDMRAAAMRWFNNAQWRNRRRDKD